MKPKIALKGLLCLALAGSVTLSAEAANISVNVHKSDGTPLSGVSVSYKKPTSSTYSFGTTNTDGVTSKTLTDDTYILILRYNNTEYYSEPTAFVGSNISVDFYTTAVNFNAIGAVDNVPVSGVNIQLSPTGGSWYHKGSTDATGTKTNEFFPGNYFIRGTKGQTSNSQPITISGDGVTAGASMDFNHYLTKVTFKAQGGAPVQNVSGVQVWYRTTESGSQYSLGTTNASGEMTTYLYPGSFYFSGRMNLTSDNQAVTISGDGTDATAYTEVTSNLTRVTFTNSGSMQYKIGGSYYNISSGTPKFLYPGTYTFRFRGSYFSDIAVSGAEFNKTAAIIVLKDYAGNPLALSTGQKHNGTTTNIGSFEAHEDNPVGTSVVIQDKKANNVWKFNLKKNNSTSAWIEQDLTSNNVFNFQAGLLTVKADDCQTGAPLSGMTFTYKIGSYTYHMPGGALGADGIRSMDIFAGTSVDVRGTLNGTSKLQTLVASGNDTLTYLPTKVKFNYPYVISYIDNAGYSRFVPTGNQTFLFAGEYTFNFRTDVYGQTINAAHVIPSSDVTCFLQKTPVIVRLKSSTNAPLADGTASFYQTSWKNAIAPTNANGYTIFFADGAPATLSVSSTYEGSREQKNHVNIASVNNVVTFQTNALEMTLIDADGNPITTGTYSYYAGAWRNFGTGVADGAGKAYQELLNTEYSISWGLNGLRKQINNYDFSSDNNAVCQASKFVVRFVDASGNPISGATVSYYASGWRTLGSTDADGYSSIEDMISGVNFTVKVTKSPYNSSVVYNIPTTNLYDTLVFVNGSIGVMTEAVSMMESSAVSLYPNPATDAIHLDFLVAGSTIDIVSIDGKVIKTQLSQSSQERVDISSLVPGNYMAVITHNGNRQTIKFTKQ